MYKYFKYIILFLIQLIEKIEYRNLSLDENDISKKILDSIKLENFYIDTPEGFSKITEVHKTQPYTIWKIKTKRGLSLECADNHIVFDNLDNEIFVKNLKIGWCIQTKNGLDEVVYIKKLPFKVSMYDISVDNKSHTYYSNDIKSHNTTTISAYFAWYMCFHNDRNLAILANKQATAWEIVNKVTDVFKGLPFFMKPGIVTAGAGGMRLDNGCFLTSQATTKTAQIGFTIHVLYADEFAHIQHNIANDFYRSVYPTLASSEVSQCIISSTPNGTENIFFEIWDKSQKKQNSFMSIRVDWWEVPGHDDAWAEKMKRDFGEERFDQEFGLDFGIGSSNLLLRAQDLKFIKRITRDYIHHTLYNTSLEEDDYNNLLWHPEFDPNDQFEKTECRFILSVDTGEGKDESEEKDNDYNICNIFRVEPKTLPQLKKLKKDELTIENMFRIAQVGLYRDNIKDEEVCAKVTRSAVFDIFGTDLSIVLVEMNFSGKFFIEKMSQHPKYDESVILQTFHTKPIPGEKEPPKKPGFKVTGENKDYFCKLTRKLVTMRNIILTETETTKEFQAFGKTKKGKYKGLGVHDDIAMSTVNISRLYVEDQYKDWLYDFLDEMEDSKLKRFINELLDQYVENDDVDDSTFDILFGGEEETPTTFSIPQHPKYTPGFTFNRTPGHIPNWQNR